jgi:hypothetical protein
MLWKGFRRLLTVIVGCLSASVFLWGCGRSAVDSQGPLVVVGIDLQSEPHLSLSGPIFSAPSPLVPARTMVGSLPTCPVERMIEGNQYCGQMLIESRTAQDVVTVLETWYRLSGRPGEALDMYVSSKLCFEIRVRGFDHGILRNLGTGLKLKPPFIFGAGEYHLEAMPTEKGGLEHAAPVPAEKPSIGN